MLSLLSDDGFSRAFDAHELRVEIEWLYSGGNSASNMTFILVQHRILPAAAELRVGTLSGLRNTAAPSLG